MRLQSALKQGSSCSSPVAHIAGTPVAEALGVAASETLLLAQVTPQAVQDSGDQVGAAAALRPVTVRRAEMKRAKRAPMLLVSRSVGVALLSAAGTALAVEAAASLTRVVADGTTSWGEVLLSLAQVTPQAVQDSGDQVGAGAASRSVGGFGASAGIADSSLASAASSSPSAQVTPQAVQDSGDQVGAAAASRSDGCSATAADGLGWTEGCGSASATRSSSSAQVTPQAVQESGDQVGAGAASRLLSGSATAGDAFGCKEASG